MLFDLLQQLRAPTGCLSLRREHFCRNAPVIQHMAANSILRSTILAAYQVGRILKEIQKK